MGWDAANLGLDSESEAHFQEGPDNEDKAQADKYGILGERYKPVVVFIGLPRERQSSVPRQNLSVINLLSPRSVLWHLSLPVHNIISLQQTDDSLVGLGLGWIEDVRGCEAAAEARDTGTRT